jgi:hypothetical protein
MGNGQAPAIRNDDSWPGICNLLILVNVAQACDERDDDNSSTAGKKINLHSLSSKIILAAQRLTCTI